MHQMIRTAEVAAPRDRFDVWRETVMRAAMPVRAESPYAHDFTATLQAGLLGPVAVLSLEQPTLAIERTRAHIRRADPECYVLILNLVGSQRIDQDRRSAILRPGDLTVYHSSLPMQAQLNPMVEREAAVVVTIPQGELSMPAERLRPLLATCFHGDKGIGAVVSAYLRALGLGGALADPVAGVRLAHITLDLIAVMLSTYGDAPTLVTADSRRRALLARVELFILSHLGDPSLTPEAVAVAHHISLRSLQRLFEASGSSVAGWIRQQRLKRCQRDLADPAFASLRVGAIGSRWGFGDAAHFSRAYKQAYGCSPAEYRAAQSTQHTQRAKPAKPR